MNNGLMLGLVGLVLFGLIQLQQEDHKILKSVKNSSKELSCFIGSDYKTIEPEKITDFIDGRWYFTNGSASNCRVK